MLIYLCLLGCLDKIGCLDIQEGAAVTVVSTDSADLVLEGRVLVPYSSLISFTDF